MSGFCPPQTAQGTGVNAEVFGNFVDRDLLHQFRSVLEKQFEVIFGCAGQKSLFPFVFQDVSLFSQHPAQYVYKQGTLVGVFHICYFQVLRFAVLYRYNMYFAWHARYE